MFTKSHQLGIQNLILLEHTGSNSLSIIDEANNPLDESGSPHLSTTWACAFSAPFASITVENTNKKLHGHKSIAE